MENERAEIRFHTRANQVVEELRADLEAARAENAELKRQLLDERLAHENHLIAIDVKLNELLKSQAASAGGAGEWNLRTTNLKTG
jgi:hypothetical protein